MTYNGYEIETTLGGHILLYCGDDQTTIIHGESDLIDEYRKVNGSYYVADDEGNLEFDCDMSDLQTYIGENIIRFIDEYFTPKRKAK